MLKNRYFVIDLLKSDAVLIHPAPDLTDMDNANDIALISDTLPKVQELLISLELASNKVGLCLNA
jgi:hypothetical protein